MVKKLLLLLGIISAFVLAIIILCILVLHILFTPERTKHMLIGNLSVYLHQQVNIGSVDLNIMKGELVLNDIEVFKKKNRRAEKIILVEIEKVLLQFDIFSPVKGNAVIKTLGVVKPKINIKQLPKLSVSNLQYKKKMFSLVNATISRFFINKGEICYAIDKSKNKLLEFDNIRTSASDISFRNLFNLKFSSDINFANKKYYLTLDADFDLIEKTIKLRETELISQDSVVKITGKIFDFIEEPSLDLNINAKRSVLADFKEILGLPYPIILIPKNKYINLKLEGTLDNLKINMSN